MPGETEERYAALRREGYDGFGASIEMGLTGSEARALEGAYRKSAPEPSLRPKGRRPGSVSRSPSGLLPDTPAWLGPAFDADAFAYADSKHVVAIMQMGGFPRGTGTHWVGPGGNRWGVTNDVRKRRAA